ncbi:MAG: VWA domain-containing protein [Acidimicrobiaceae bacterium]|nr:VWA domain-containing protein [Acidimicrobiaceae bacterium]MYA74126.1 VWA domain-containing protein [Acidimicrobiaceae bacterium]MYD07672.1 VWA domain-containing protein [Acidimicrobiaceae bacterium]MYG55276.1 VWA domain-containing protein [Acidimicrobiaceae bacterium]MYI59717.1 VWA domain-containing protein [Acidimicrobiaceae bacterium]
MADPDSTTVSNTPVGIVDRLVGFGHALREHGLPVGSDDVLTFCAATAELSPGDPNDVYWSGRTTLVHRRDHLPVYDEVFRTYFLNLPMPPDSPTAPERPVPQGNTGTLDVPDSEPGDEQGDDQPLVLGLQASSIEIEREKRFAACSPEELIQLRRIMARIRLEPPRRRTRRQTHCRTGPRIDIRRMARDAMRLSDGTPELHRIDRKERTRPLVLLLDVSGSMADHSRNLLQFAYSMRRAAQKVEVFCFGTRLTRITGALDRRNPDDAMSLAAARVLDWDGGTRIGASLDHFVRKWGRRGLSRGATVVICSDGLDRGDPRLLTDSMEKLSRLSHRIIWMNPLIGNDVDAPPDTLGMPNTLGMLAAGPYIDELASGHDLASLERFAARLPTAGG